MGKAKIFTTAALAVLGIAILMVLNGYHPLVSILVLKHMFEIGIQMKFLATTILYGLLY